MISNRNLPSFGVKDKSELIVRLRDLHNIHETGRKVGICSSLSVNFHVLLHAYHLGLLASQGIF